MCVCVCVYIVHLQRLYNASMAACNRSDTGSFVQDFGLYRKGTKETSCGGLTARHPRELAFAVDQHRGNLAIVSLRGLWIVEHTAIDRCEGRYISKRPRRNASARKRRCIKKRRARLRGWEMGEGGWSRRETAENCEAIAINCTQALSLAFAIPCLGILAILKGLYDGILPTTTLGIICTPIFLPFFIITCVAL